MPLLFGASGVSTALVPGDSVCGVVESEASAAGSVRA